MLLCLMPDDFTCLERVLYTNGLTKLSAQMPPTFTHQQVGRPYLSFVKLQYTVLAILLMQEIILHVSVICVMVYISFLLLILT
jgi:hypothetical protein